MTRDEEIIKAAKEIAQGIEDWELAADIEDAFIEGAWWADRTMIDKACEWLQHNVYRFFWKNCTQQEHGVYIDKLLEQFKKAMEGGEK